jgi:serine/threonine protein phosphatase 1
MIKNLLAKFRRPPTGPTQPHVPKNQRIYCIGDIHGRADLLQQLHQQILTDANNYKGKKTIVYLGDYIDRGEQSRQVIELLISNPLPDFISIYLMGNHEQILLSFLEYPESSAAWLSFGGKQALNSYGIPLAHVPTMREVVELAKQLDRKLPDTHRSFLQNCATSWQCGSYYFVHAGIDPNIALDKQGLDDQLWIRGEFLESNKDHGAIVVHGHSITFMPELLPNRIGIDTGAFSTGVLTCLVLEGSDQRCIQTSPIMDHGLGPG